MFPQTLLRKVLTRQEAVLYPSCYCYHDIWLSLFKNIISNGLVLDKNGIKCRSVSECCRSFHYYREYGSDPLRWYMITNSQPWDNLKFDISGIDEVKRKFFGTLYNTYSFFALYANVDNFRYAENEIPLSERPEIDRWIISLLNSLVKEVGRCYEDYDLTHADVQYRILSPKTWGNWYVPWTGNAIGEVNMIRISLPLFRLFCLSWNHKPARRSNIAILHGPSFHRS